MRDLFFLMSTPLVMAIFASALLVIWHRDRDRRENLALAGGWLLLGAGFSISILSPEHWGRNIATITHVPYTLAAIVMSRGLLGRIGVQPPTKPQLWVALVGFAVLLFVQNVGDNIQADLLVTNLTCGVIFVMTAQLFANAGKRDLIEQFLFVMIVLTAAQFFLRPAMTLMVDGPLAATTYRSSIYYLAMLWVFAFGSVLFGLAQVAGAVKDHVNEMRDDAATDALSGLLVRSEFERRVDAALAKANVQTTNVALVVGDIDHFKQVNDIWGHQAGDGAITAFGGMVSSMIRGSDIAGRVGGEEFCILVWNANEEIASGLAERLRQRTSQLEIGTGALDVRLTASFGVSERIAGETYRSLFARADAALYEAKQNGRDRVIKASEGAAGTDSPRSNDARELSVSPKSNVAG